MIPVKSKTMTISSLKRQFEQTSRRKVFKINTLIKKTYGMVSTPSRKFDTCPKRSLIRKASLQSPNLVNQKRKIEKIRNLQKFILEPKVGLQTPIRKSLDNAKFQRFRTALKMKAPENALKAS